MIEFTNTIIDGFCSINHLELPLNTKGITVIRGANGFGKSTIFSALVWCIYGKNLKGKAEVNTWKKFQPKNYLGTKVEVYFRSQDNRVHRIIRCLKYNDNVDGSKGNNRLIYQIDGVTITERGKRSIQDIINSNLGMSYNLFINSVMFGQGLKRLVQETGTNQREIFEEIFELGYLTKAKKIAQDKYNESNQEYQKVFSKIGSINNTLQVLESNLSSIKESRDNYKAAQKEAILNLKEKLSSLQEEKVQLDKELKGKESLETLKDRFTKLENKIKIEKDKLGIAKQATGIPLENLIDKIIKLLLDKDYNASLRELNTLKEAFKTQEKCKSKILEYQDKSAKVDKEWFEVRDLDKRYKRLEEQIVDYNNRIANKKKEAPNFKDSLDNTKSKIAELNEELEQYNSTLEVYKENKELYQWAYTDPLGNMGIKSYLFESCLHQLNDILGTYSETLGFSIKFNVDLNSARKDFQTYIGLDGQTVTYEELSGGQKQLVNLAMAFSMNSMVAQSQGLNISFLDEVFESLSDDNIEIVIGLIKKVYQDKTLFLITHKDSLPIPNSRVLRVKRVRGLSEYEL